jgi:hypothetical protein
MEEDVEFFHRSVAISSRQYWAEAIAPAEGGSASRQEGRGHKPD